MPDKRLRRICDSRSGIEQYVPGAGRGTKPKGGNLVKYCCFSSIAIACFLLFATPSPAQQYDFSPHAKADGGRWRIGYMEGGHYNDYVPVLKAILERLVQLEWLESGVMECVADADRSRQIWSCLEHAESPYLEFPADAYWSAAWDNDKRILNKRLFLERASKRNDLDLMLALGTWAGLDLSNDHHHVPTVVCSTSNALGAGIIHSAEDSGHDHVHARIDPTRYARQVALFHKVVGFKRLGVVYEDSPEGRTYAGLDQINPLAARLGFELISCQAPFSNVSLEASVDSVMACHQELAAKVDAMYVTIHRGVNSRSICRLLQPFMDARIPTFAMGTLYEVNAGALMSIAQPDFSYAGDFYAETMARILNGEKPRDISQILLDPQDLRVNVETARRIEFHLPVEVLSDARELVESIDDCRDTP